MRGRGDSSERRTLTVVMAAGLATVLIMLWLSPGEDADAALSAAIGAPAKPLPAKVATGGAVAEPQPDVGLDALLQRQLEPRVQVSLPVLADARIAGWVNDLRDDGIRFNAGDAMVALIQLPPGEIPELVQALDAYDEQLRHFAAGVLRARCDQDKAAVLPALLEVSITALRSDLGPVQQAAYATWVGPLMQRSARFLQRHAAAAQDLLAAQLTSFDPQQRFYCAYLLTQSGLGSHPDARRLADRIAFELVRHLGDNQVGGDAQMATNGLYRLGESVLPILLDNHRYLDDQGRKLIELIQLDIKQPPRTRREFYARGNGYRVSTLYHDVAVEYDMQRSSLPTIGR